jgi:hypothetical protein
MLKKRKADGKNWPMCPWTELRRRMEAGYVQSLCTLPRYHVLMSNFLDSETKISYRYLFTGFYEAEQPPSRDVKAVCQIVGDALGTAHGVTFNRHTELQFKGDHGVPSALAKCASTRYKCQQQERKFAPSTLDYKKTRIRRRKLSRFDCGGRIIILYQFSIGRDIRLCGGL